VANACPPAGSTITAVQDKETEKAMKAGKALSSRMWMMGIFAVAVYVLVLGPPVVRATDFTGTWERGDEVIELRANKTGVYKNKDTGEVTEFKWSTTDQKNSINIYYSPKRTWTAQIEDGEKSILVKKGTGLGYIRFNKK
jgi:hypothetical protein